MAICLFIDVEESVSETFESEKQQAHSLYRLSSLSGFMMLKKRLKVSWEGVDSSPGMKLLKKSIFIFPIICYFIPCLALGKYPSKSY
jgi:hypothetical protein